MIEVEIRAMVEHKEKENIINKLKEKGFSNVYNTIQHDIMLDTPKAALFNSGKKIRIRIEDKEVTLTYKGDLRKYKDVSKRTELNIPIKKDEVENCITFLTELGYPICFQIKKDRKVYRNKNIEVTFDEWPIIGTMIEIEGPEDDIKKLALEIAPNLKFSNYRLKELFQNKMNETGKSLQELKEIYYKENKFDLGHIELVVE